MKDYGCFVRDVLFFFFSPFAFFFSLPPPARNKDGNRVIIFVIYGAMLQRSRDGDSTCACLPAVVHLQGGICIVSCNPSTTHTHTLLPPVECTHYVSLCITVVSSSCEMSIALHETAFLGVNIDIELLPYFALKQPRTSIAALLRTLFCFF